MTILDIIFFIFLCWFGFLGFKHGLIYEITTLTSLILGVWAAYHFSDKIIAWLPNTALAQPVAFIVTFVIVLILVHLLGRLIQKVIRLAIPGFVDHLFGLLFGAGKVIIVFSVLFYFIRDIDKREIILTPKTKTKSIAYKYVEPVVPHLMTWGKQPTMIPDIKQIKK